ncbi:MAG: TfuA-like protein, partial [Aestuariivirgaceae bacterium]
GDIYRSRLSMPQAIGIIDGYFHGVASVWHKEILWAMSKGITVYGSASMGALRAAELHAFGMRGVGDIFEAYRTATIEDDDEVAVAHAPAELAFKPLSEPMVNIRASIDKAKQDKVLSGKTARRLTDVAKSIFYMDRTWDEMFGTAAGSKLPADEIAAFKDWLPAGRVDLKRQDALAMLAVMRDDLAGEVPAAEAAYDFEWTTMWDGEVSAWSNSGTQVQQILDELRLDEQLFSEVRARALLRVLALRQGQRENLPVERAALMDKLTDHRAGLGLFRRQNLDQWLIRNDLDTAGYESLIADQHLVDKVVDWLGDAVHQHMLAELKLSGQYDGIADRARRKQAVIASDATAFDAIDDGMANPIDLVVWYFEEVCSQSVPDNLDGFARLVGLNSREELYRILAREQLYLTLGNDDHADS